MFLVEIDTWNNPGEVYVDNRTLAVYPFGTLDVNREPCILLAYYCEYVIISLLNIITYVGTNLH